MFVKRQGQKAPTVMYRKYNNQIYPFNYIAISNVELLYFKRQ
jgi:hypothetical protein